MKDKRQKGLYMIPAAQTRDKDAVSEEQMKQLCEELKKDFDYILIDCPAGIEQGFKNAVAGADKAIVVTTPEVSAVRDADRIIGLLEASGLNEPKLIINRLRPGMVKKGEMMDVEDIIELLAIPVIGVVPDDESIIVTTNKGEPVVMDEKSKTGQAYRNISKRVMGEQVPLLNLEDETILDKFKKLFSKKS